MSMGKTVLRALGWSAIQHWGSHTISFVVFLILARQLPTEAFGLVAFATVFTSLLQLFVDQGLSDAIVQRSTLDREHLDTSFVIALVAGIVLALLGVTIATPIAEVFDQPKLAPVIRWLSLGFVLTALSSTQQAILRRNLQFRMLAYRSLSSIIVGGTTGVVMALAGFGVWSLVGQSLMNSLTGVVVLWSTSSWRPRLRLSLPHFRDLVGFSVNTLGINLLNFANQRLDDLLIGAVLGPIALGYYTVGYKVFRIATMLLTGISSSVAFSAFARVQEAPNRVHSAFLKATRFTSLVSFPAFVGLALVASEFVHLVYGVNWSASVPVMQVLAFMGILHSVYYFNDTVMAALGKQHWRLRLTLLNAVGNLIAFAIAVRWGIVAVALAYTIRGYLFSPLPLLALRRLIRLDLIAYLRQFAAPFAGCIAMALAVFATRLLWSDELSHGGQFIVHSIIGAVTYLAVAGWLGRTSISEVRVLIRSAREVPTTSAMQTSTSG